MSEKRKKKTEVRPYERSNPKSPGTHKVSGHTREIGNQKNNFKNKVPDIGYDSIQPDYNDFDYILNSDWVEKEGNKSHPYRWELDYEEEIVEFLDLKAPLKRHSTGRKLRDSDIVEIEVTPTHPNYGTSFERGDTDWFLRGTRRDDCLVHLSERFDTPEEAKEKALEIMGEKDG